MVAPNRPVPTWDLADRLRKIRRDVMHVQQHDMADALGVGRQGYAAWEAGRTQPRDIVALAKRLELLCGVSASWVLGLQDGAAAADASTPKIAAVSADLGRGINPHCSPSAATRRIVHGSTVGVGPLGDDPAAGWAAVA